jgi:hypothetical protein
MRMSPEEQQALQQAAALEGPVVEVENALTALGLALHQQDADAVVRAADALHVALAAAVLHVGRAARNGGVPQPLRQRLAHAGGQVAAQREALARATASLDRAIDVLIPDFGANQPGSVYSAGGLNDRPASRGSLLA